jgi:hypothetical protein
MSPRDDSTALMNESRHLSHDSLPNVRDPFILHTHSKNPQHSLPPPPPSSSSTLPASGNMDRSWQSYVQQQYQQMSASFGSRPARSNNVGSGSITQGSPISPSTRPSVDSQQYTSATNNQLVNPRYSYYMNKSNIKHIHGINSLQIIFSLSIQMNHNIHHQDNHFKIIHPKANLLADQIR